MSRPSKRPWRQALGGRAREQGRGAEWLAALWLMLKGYQVLGFRLRSRAGEIDILARRGGVLAVVEVKRRRTLEAALTAILPDQAQRLATAGEAVRRHKPGLQKLRLRIDTVALCPGRFPVHVRGPEF